MGLWREASIFDVVRLIAHAHYLLRTTRIHCIWHSLREPSELEEFRIFLNSLESDYEDVAPPLEEDYKPLTNESDPYASYYQEELSIAIRKIQDVREIFDQLLAREIDGAFEYSDYINVNEYVNMFPRPPITKIRMRPKYQMEIVAKLIEQRIEDD